MATPDLSGTPATEAQVENLWPDGSPNNPPAGPRPTLEIFHPFNKPHAARATIVILPGGGYAGLSPYERMQAHYFRALGYTAAVVNYRVIPNRYPAAYADATRALRLLRRHGRDWGISAENIALLGGSAGGHLAALVSTRPDLFIDPGDDLGSDINARPDRVILLYPVIVATGSSAPASIDRLLGPNTSDDVRRTISPDLHVDSKTPSALIFHAADDPVVNVQNSIRFAEACWSAGIETELHVFARGGHGKDFSYDADLSPRWRRIVEEWLAAWLESTSRK